MLQVKVYKTNVKNKTQIKKIGKILRQVGHIKAWNFDLEDCDKILRIETDHAKLNICTKVKNLGFKIEEIF
jgi:hypothetical protein